VLFYNDSSLVSKRPKYLWGGYFLENKKTEEILDFIILTAVTVKNAVFWIVTLCTDVSEEHIAKQGSSRCRQQAEFSLSLSSAGLHKQLYVHSHLNVKVVSSIFRVRNEFQHSTSKQAY
jgi:hypothetical protein